MQKKALLALLLAVTLLLSGCALVVKDQAVDAAQIIITMGDKQYTKGEVNTMVQSQLAYMKDYYEYYGYSFDPTDAGSIADAQEAAIDYILKDAVKEQHISEAGLDVLSDEELTDLQAQAQTEHDEMYEMLESIYYSGSDLSDEEKSARIEEELKGYGYDVETYTEYLKNNLVEERLTDMVTADVTVSEEEITAAFDEKVAADQETYGEDASGYANAMNKGTVLYYAPEGVRLVKQILVKFHDDDQESMDALDAAVSDASKTITAANTAIADAEVTIDEAEATLADEEADEEAKAAATEAKATAENDKATAEADREAAEAARAKAEAELAAAKTTALANLDEEADAILAQLAEGADWDTLMAEKTADPGMQSGKTAEIGYAVCENMSGFDSAFTDAAMALEKIGDVSGKTASELYGYYIIRYVGDVTPGAAEMTEDMHTEIEADLLKTAKDTFYTETVEKWVEECGAVIDRAALNN